MINPCAVSVLMPVYNGEKYLTEAIESVLKQTYIDFEFLAINDGSTDGTEAIIREYARKDSRVRYIANEKNLGLVEALNRGLAIAGGKYIARMDADDVCHPERFEKQVNFLETHPEVTVCGTSYKCFGAKDTTHMLPVEHEAIKASLIFGSVICHPSVFFRNSYLRKEKLRYLQETFPAEDYKIWVMAAKSGRLHNIPEVLLYYREHPAQISTVNDRWQKAQTDKIRLEMLDWLYTGFSDKNKQYHLEKFVPGKIEIKADLKDYRLWIERLMAANQQTGNFSEKALKHMLKNQFKQVVLRWVHQHYFANKNYNLKNLIKYLGSGLAISLSPKQNLKILLKSLSM
ncbi:MAG: glycosyltransferase family 2 protein [Bacteroidales bacterium]|nr:glycosyltransferase family 2 protein [Bacteroidales bacterium]